MPLAYSNNGLSMRGVPVGYQPQEGEVLFPDGVGLPTSDQLTQAFDGYAAAAAAAGAPATVAAKLLTGVTLTSTGTPALNAVYALDPVSYSEIFQIGTYANSFGVFPNGASTFEYPDASSEPHTFAVTAFVNLLKAVAPLVAAIQTQGAILAAGGSPTWPAQTATIA